MTQDTCGPSPDFCTYVKSSDRNWNEHIHLDMADSKGILESLVKFEVICRREKIKMDNEMNNDTRLGTLTALLAKQEAKLLGIISAFTEVGAHTAADQFRKWTPVTTQQTASSTRAPAPAPPPHLPSPYNPSTDSAELNGSQLTGHDQISHPSPNVPQAVTEINWSQDVEIVPVAVDEETVTRLTHNIQQTTQSYEAGKTKSRYALIVNNINFPNDKKNKNACRAAGGLEDAVRVKQVLEGCGFTVFYIKDCKTQDLETTDGKLDQFIRFVQFQKASAVAVFLMSHGAAFDLMQMHDSTHDRKTWLNYDEQVIEKFSNDKCEKLIGVPKMFFLQLCRGSEFDEGVLAADGEVTIVPIDGTAQANWNPAFRQSRGPTHHVPTFSDILIAYSCYQYFTSWKVGGTGSWFMQTLCDAIEIDKKQNKPLDISQLLVKVNEVIRERKIQQQVQIREKGKAGIRKETRHWKQICPFVNVAFTKAFYFNNETPETSFTPILPKLRTFFGGGRK